MVSRNHPNCPNCGNQLIPINKDMGKNFVGDTFTGRYEPCPCQKPVVSGMEGKDEKLWIKIGKDIIQPFDRNKLGENIFDIETDGMMFQITNDNGHFSVSNAVDGYGINRRKDFEKHTVTFLTEQSPIIKVTGKTYTGNPPASLPTQEAIPAEESSELSEALEWMALFYGALHELVQLKQNKEQEGETPDYLERKPKAWHLAKEAIRLWKESDYGSLPIPSTQSGNEPQGQWQLCPKCNGQGTVTKPPYIPGDVNEWISASAVHTCDVCNGAKIIAPPSTHPVKQAAGQDQKAEIERLKGLIETAYSSAYNRGYMDCRDKVENKENPFDQFARDNKL